MLNPREQENASESPAFRLSRDARGRLTLFAKSGEQYVGVKPIRLFPISSPDRWVVLCDSAGHELACLEDLASLDAETRHILEAELTSREFVPVIERIVHVSANTEPCEWTVETDRGRTSFILGSEDDIRRLGQFGVLIFDANGIRYLIPDERTLDAASKKVVEWYV